MVYFFKCNVFEIIRLTDCLCQKRGNYDYNCYANVSWELINFNFNDQAV